MNFIPYSSIENSCREKFLQIIKDHGLDRGPFVVQEKVHGANFSLHCDKAKIVRGAKRSGFIEDEKFFNASLITEEYQERMINLFESLKHYHKSVSVFGELFGGRYDHPEVPKAGVKAIQKGVQYCPEQRFIAFDIMVEDQFLDMDHAKDLCSNFGIDFLPILYRGTLQGCLEYPNDFETKVPSLFDLPPIPGNICEGVVIKPVQYLTTPVGARVILKNKNEKFKEVAKPPKVQIDISPENQKLLALAESYVCDNRLRNVLSKIGEVQQQDFGKVSKMFVEDVLEELSKEQESFDDKFLKKALGKSCANLMRRNWVNIIDGVF